jgi:hypothetical protein
MFDLIGSPDSMRKLLQAVLTDEQGQPFTMTAEEYLDMPFTMTGEMIADFFTLNPSLRELTGILLTATLGLAAEEAASNGTAPSSGSTLSA